MSTDRPIFIIGAQRSGTTLVRLMLDAHPNLSIGPETSFLGNIAQGVSRAMGTDRTRLREDTFTVGRDDVEGELGAAWGRVFARHAANQGASRWGDKSPVHRFHGARIKRLYPGAQVIAVVRHPAAVARSRARWGYAWEDTVEDWAATVRHHHTDARRFGARRFHLVRYEDLLDDPRTVIGDVLVFLHEPWDPAVLDHTAGTEAGMVTDGGTVMSAPLDPSRRLAWRDDVGDDDLAVLEAQATAEMALVGYAADRDQPILPRPDNELAAAAPPPHPARAAGRVLRQRGLVEVARRAAVEVRERGLGGALGRWRRL